MTLPLFLDFEASSPEPEGYPVAAAWSLPDGRIKSVLIIPEDEWTHWEEDSGDIHLDYHDNHHLHGVSGLDVVREMNEDLHDQIVYCDGLAYDPDWLACLFDTYDMEPSFELQTISQHLGQDHPIWEWEACRQQLFEELGLEPHKAEAEVRVMQQVYLRLREEAGE